MMKMKKPHPGAGTGDASGFGAACGVLQTARTRMFSLFRDARIAQDAMFTLMEYQDSLCRWGVPVDVLCDKVVV